MATTTVKTESEFVRPEVGCVGCEANANIKSMRVSETGVGSLHGNLFGTCIFLLVVVLLLLLLLSLSFSFVVLNESSHPLSLGIYYI